ncbi:MAG: hypothetical protein E7484_05235 [Ruminococcaceae bacterium]|nr:hypothetical protein [Oscillospiraceae bacterium]
MSGYNNDYNKDLYTAQSSDFCKSCYSSGKSREGCLVVIAAAVCGCVVYFAAASLTGSSAAAVAVTTAVAAAFIIRKCRKNKKQDR